MSFHSPLWLFGFIPWIALAVWMLWGKRPAAVVPFIDLWRGPVTGKYVERSVHVPPRAIVMILLATALGILAASGPALLDRGGVRIAIVVDRGITMSATGSKLPRYVETSAVAASALRETIAAQRIGRAEVRIVVVPDGEPRDSSVKDWTSLVSHLPPTAIDTRDAIVAAVAREREKNDLTLVVSDQRIAFTDDRVVQIAPAETAANVGIVMLAAREDPSAQLMVRVRNDSPLAGAKLIVTTVAGERIEQDMKLPPRGEEANAFIALPKADDVIHATLVAGDSLVADNEAWLVREQTRPVIEVRAEVPASLRRMIDVYSRTPAGGGEAGGRVAVVEKLTGLGVGESGVVLANGAAKPQAADTAPVVADHPVTRNIGWSNVLKEVAVAPAPQGWTPVASLGGAPVVAVSEDNGRRVWVGFHSALFPRSTDYVIFWANVFDWLGRGGEAFVAHPVKMLPDEWRPVAMAGNAPPDRPAWPGLYRRASDGALRAVNAPAPQMQRPTDAGWDRRLGDILESHAVAGGTRLAPWLLLAALGCLLAAGVWWPGVGLTRFSGGRTV